MNCMYVLLIHMSSLRVENMGNNATLSSDSNDTDAGSAVVDFGDTKVDKGFQTALHHYNRVCALCQHMILLYCV